MAMRRCSLALLGRRSAFCDSTALRNSQTRWMSTASATLPQIGDAEAQKALKHLYAINWYNLDRGVGKLVEGTLKRSDTEVLRNSWRAALAVEEFYDTLETLRQQIDTLMGVSGEGTGPLPEKFQKALEVAHSRYAKYLASFGQDEQYLKKKVEVELGSIMILLKQRCSGLDAKWGEVGLIGTSGLSGSYIEKRE